MSSSRRRDDEVLDHGRNAWRDRGKPRRYRTDETCKEKKRYTDEVGARAGGVLSLQEMKNRYRLWVYRCKSCAGWHLTHSDQGRRWALTARDPAPAIAGIE